MKKIIVIVFLGGFFSISLLAQTLPSGAVGVWRMDENTGTVTADASGNGNNGTLLGATWTTGVIGSGLHFDGSGYVNIPDDATLRPGLFTMSAWVRNSGPVTSDQVIAGKSAFATALNEQYVLYLNSSGVPSIGIKRISSCTVAVGWYNVTGTTPVDDGEWHHIVSTWDGSEIRIYVDCVLEGTNSGVPAGIIDNCVGGDLRLGIWWASFPQPYIGDLDELYIFDRALTETEIAELCTLSAPPIPTLSQWGIIILGLSILCMGAVSTFLMRRKRDLMV